MSGKLGAHDKEYFNKATNKNANKDLVVWLIKGDGLGLIYRGFLPRRGLNMSAF